MLSDEGLFPQAQTRGAKTRPQQEFPNDGCERPAYHRKRGLPTSPTQGHRHLLIPYQASGGMSRVSTWPTTKTVLPTPCLAFPSFFSRGKRWHLLSSQFHLRSPPSRHLPPSMNSHSLEASLPPELAAWVSSVSLLSRMNFFMLALAPVPPKHEQIHSCPLCLPAQQHLSPPAPRLVQCLFQLFTFLLSHFISGAYTASMQSSRHSPSEDLGPLQHCRSPGLRNSLMEAGYPSGEDRIHGPHPSLYLFYWPCWATAAPGRRISITHGIQHS